MTDWEAHIRKAASADDSLEPNAGHTDRFRKKLAPPAKEHPMQMIWWAAAILVVGLLVAQAVPRRGVDSGGDRLEMATIGLSDISPEMAEVESYFVQEIGVKKRCLATEGDVEKASYALQELDRLESQYQWLKEELAKQPGDERVIRYMVENYKLRLTLLELHLEKMKKYKTNRLDSIQ